MSYAEESVRHRRYAILRILSRQTQREANSAVLRTALDALAHPLSHDALAGELAWLEEQGLVTLEALSDLQIARLTRRGQDLVEDRASHPGVWRPEP